jgi:uncharacterized 2Fe-2S/4Fe-4S cluster protein (DUF4445 family)
MSHPVRIELQPLGQTLVVEQGTPLQDILFAQGVEFPCGGRGRCRGCRIKVLAGRLDHGAEDAGVFTPEELQQGWRLACRAKAGEDLVIELAQWEAAILADHSSIAGFKPRPGWGVAVDLGTTTMVAQLLDLASGHVLGVRTGLNEQARQGADIMSRVDFALRNGGLETLRDLARRQIGAMVADLCASAGLTEPSLESVVVVGNTVMHHLFCGVDVSPLAHTPFEPVDDGLRQFKGGELGWTCGATADVHFLPCLGGFVGSDILAGILGTRLHETDSLRALIDLGTNGEIVVGNREGMVCSSTAAGPAFEGARISMGMRAATGAISEVKLENGWLTCHVLGQGEPRGICGSGLVDAIAVALDMGWVKPSGRLADGEAFVVAAPVSITQGDVRELQLAKGAIAAGVRMLASKQGATLHDISEVQLAGAFGNYINRGSARRIGLIDFPIEKVGAAGNTALLGAKIALLGLPQLDLSFSDILRKTTHVSLSEDVEFQDIYAREMAFP